MTMHHWNMSYQGEQTPLITRDRPRQTSVRRTTILGIILLACLAVTMLFTHPTMHELELFQLYNDNTLLPTRYNTRRMRLAQRTANLVQSNVLKHDLVRATHGRYNITDRHHSKKIHTTAPEGCESTVVIVRHCEKDNIREHCDYLGFERSVYLATLFGHDHERWPAPDLIVALAPGGRHKSSKLNFREVETAGPLAKKLGVPIDYSYNDKSVNDLASDLVDYIKTGAMCGKVSLVVWKHSLIGHLAHHLGCGPEQGCPLDYYGRNFDTAWQIKFVYRTPQYSHKKSLKIKKNHPKWEIYGSVQPENFDPLAFSKLVGDYSIHGSNSTSNAAISMAATTGVSTPTYPHWLAGAVQIPKRTSETDKRTWDLIKRGESPQQILQERLQTERRRRHSASSVKTISV